MRLPALITALALFVMGCSPTPDHVRVSPEAMAKLQGQPLTGVTEAPPEFRHRIRKNQFVSRGGSLIGVAIALTATAVSAAVENAASDIDQMRTPEMDIAARVERELATAMAEETGAIYDPSSAIADDARSYTHNQGGQERLVAAAKALGHAGAVIDVRSESVGINSSGIRTSGPETFVLTTKLSVRVIDAVTGVELGRSQCNSGRELGSLATYQRNVAEYAAGAEAYAEATLASTALIESGASAPAAISDVEVAPVEIPKPYLEDLEDQIVRQCVGVLKQNLL